MKTLGCLIIALLISPFLYAQEASQNTLYLKNGNMIRGHIVEFIPDSIVRIQTADGSLFIFRSDELRKISADSISAHSMQDSAPHLKKNMPEAAIIHVGFYGGVALPLAGFQAKDGGDAATGATFGLQLWSEKKIGFLIDASYTANNLSDASGGSWTSVFILAGPRIRLKNKDDASISIAPLAGILISKLSDGGTISANSIAYGIVMQFEIAKQLVLGVRFISGTPSYDTWIHYSAVQTTSIVNATLGIKL